MIWTSTIRFFPCLAVASLMALILGACSNGDVVPGKAVHDTVQSFQDGLAAVADGLEVVIPEEANALRSLKNATFDQSFPCDDGGTGTVTGTGTGDVSAGTFNLEMTFQGCHGMTGTVGFSGDYANDGALLTVDYDFGTGGSTSNNTLNSSLGCSIFFRDTQFFSETPLGDPEPTGTVFSAIRGSCVEPGGNVLTDCIWDNLDFNNEDLLAQNCICNGQGC